MVRAIRSELSRTHFWARFRIRARPSKPSASQPGWAARAFATSSDTRSMGTTGTLAMTSPVAGFSTSICRAGGSAVCASGTVVVWATSFLLRELAPRWRPYQGWLASQVALRGSRREEEEEDTDAHHRGERPNALLRGPPGRRRRGSPGACEQRAAAGGGGPLGRYARLGPPAPRFLEPAPDRHIRQPRRRAVLDGGRPLRDRRHGPGRAGAGRCARARLLPSGRGLHGRGHRPGGGTRRAGARSHPDPGRHVRLGRRLDAEAERGVGLARTQAHTRGARGRADAPQPLGGVLRERRRRRVCAPADAGEPPPPAAGSVRAAARRVEPPRRLRPAGLAVDAGARDRVGARPPDPGLESEGGRVPYPRGEAHGD